MRYSMFKFFNFRLNRMIISCMKEPTSPKIVKRYIYPYIYISLCDFTMPQFNYLWLGRNWNKLGVDIHSILHEVIQRYFF